MTAWLTAAECYQRMEPVFARRVKDALDHPGSITVPVREHDGRRWLSESPATEGRPR